MMNVRKVVKNVNVMTMPTFRVTPLKLVLNESRQLCLGGPLLKISSMKKKLP